MNPVQGTNLSELKPPEQNQSPSSGITVLPPELLNKILKSLPPENQTLLGRTCKTLRSISQEAFLEQKQQLTAFLKRILGSEVFSEEIEQDITNSKNFKELNRAIEQEIIPLEDPDQNRALLAMAIYEHTQPEDLPTIQFLHKIFECSPIFLLSESFCSKLSLETKDKLVDLLIEKHGLNDTYEAFRYNSYNSGPSSGLFPDSRKLQLYSFQVSPNNLEQASARLKDDKGFMLAIIEKCVPRTDASTTNVYWPESGTSICEVLNEASDRLKDDYDVVLAAVQKDGFALSYASERLRNNVGIVLAALRSKIRPEDMSEFVPEALRGDPDIQNWLSSERLLDDKEFMLNIILNCVPWAHSSGTSVYRALEDASDRLKDDYDVVLAAVQKDGFALKLASERLKNNVVIVLAALRSKIRPQFNMRHLVPVALRNNPEIAKQLQHEDLVHPQ